MGGSGPVNTGEKCSGHCSKYMQSFKGIVSRAYLPPLSCSYLHTYLFSDADKMTNGWQNIFCKSKFFFTFHVNNFFNLFFLQEFEN